MIDFRTKKPTNNRFFFSKREEAEQDHTCAIYDGGLVVQFDRELSDEEIEHIRKENQRLAEYRERLNAIRFEKRKEYEVGQHIEKYLASTLDKRAGEIAAEALKKR